MNVLARPPSDDAFEPKRFSAREFLAIYEAGLLGRDRGVQLIRGDVYIMASTGAEHAAAHGRLTSLLAGALPAGLQVAISPTIVFGAEEVYEPDIVVLARADASAGGYAAREAVRLAVEVSMSSLSMDLSGKAAAYAAAGVVEYWVMDLENRRLVVHREPEAGGYVRVERLGPGQSIAPLCAPDAAIAVADLF